MLKPLSMPTFTRYTLAILTSAALFITGTGLSPASPVESKKKTATTTVENKTVTNETTAGAAGLTLPGTLVDQPQVPLADVPEEYLEATEEAPIASTKLAHSAISSYETDNGTQTLIRINSAEASKEYRFPLSLPARATVGLLEEGAVLVKDADGEILGGYGIPWAIDANGAQIPTGFTLEGDTLIQTIDFTSEAVFPIIADPIWLAPRAIRCLIGLNLNSTQIISIAARGSIAAVLAAGGYAAVRCVLGK